MLLLSCNSYWLRGVPPNVTRVTWRRHRIDLNDKVGNPYPVRGLGGALPELLAQELRKFLDAKPK